MSDERRLFAAMCTFDRPADVVRSLAALAVQDTRPDLVIVVDNGGDPVVRDAVEASSLPTRYLDPGSNLGPAGGFAVAVEELPAEDDDLVLLLDDDDPLPSRSDLLGELVAGFDLAVEVDESTVGLALRGGVLDTRTGLIRPSPGVAVTMAPADHLHGCAYPVYRIGPLREVSAFDPSLFWGFEELAAGRALRSAGYSLVTAGGLLASVVGELPKLAPSRRTKGLSPPSWRHYYRHRNLLRILRRERAWIGMVVVMVTRMIGKPLVSAPRHPALAWWHLRTNMVAMVDGLGPEKRMTRHSTRRPA